jgi:hypothetical protein
MWVPKMTDAERHGFVHRGAWIAKLATHSPDGAIRMTPLQYAEQDGVIWFDTWDSSAAAANLRRDRRASVLIDSPTPPFRGVHFVGEAEVQPATTSAQEYADRFAAYIDDREAALQMIVMLRTIAPRVEISFRPRKGLTWDLGKLPAAPPPQSPSTL